MTSRLTIAQSQLRLADPHECTDIKDIRGIHEAIFDALVTRGPDLRIIPGLAQSWKVSGDGCTWTFFLREGVEFHNGESFDSTAVKFSIERMAAPSAGAALGAPAVYAQYLGGTQINTPNKHTLELTTGTPNADLLDILVDGYILPPQATQAMGDDFKFNPIGTGAFKFVEWVAGDRLIAEANNSYFGGTPKAKQVIWQLVPESADRTAALRKRKADIVSHIEPSAVKQITATKDAHTVKLRDVTSIIYLFNCSRGPLKDLRVRQAINLAVNKNEIIESVLHGAGYPLSGFVSPMHFGFNPEVKPYPYDPDQASNLLAQSGYEDGLIIELSTPTSLPAEALELSQHIASQLARVGIDVDLNVIPDRELYANKVRRKEIGDLCCFDSSPISTYRVLREKISSRYKGAWWQGYQNLEVDNLIEEGNRTIDENRREEVYAKCFRLIRDDPPWLFLHNHERIYGVADRLGDWRPRLDGCIIPQHVPTQAR